MNSIVFVYFFLLSNLDEQKREGCSRSVLEPIPVRPNLAASESNKDIPAVKIENGQIMLSKPSQLPMMGQVIFNEENEKHRTSSCLD